MILKSKNLRTCIKDDDVIKEEEETIRVNYVQLDIKTKITTDILLYRDRIEETNEKMKQCEVVVHDRWY